MFPIIHLRLSLHASSYHFIISHAYTCLNILPILSSHCSLCNISFAPSTVHDRSKIHTTLQHGWPVAGVSSSTPLAFWTASPPSPYPLPTHHSMYHFYHISWEKVPVLSGAFYSPEWPVLGLRKAKGQETSCVLWNLTCYFQIWLMLYL